MAHVGKKLALEATGVFSGLLGLTQVGLCAQQGFLGLLARGDVVGETAVVKDLAIFHVRAGIDKHVFDRSIFAAQANFTFAQGFACFEPAHDVGTGLGIGVELSNVVPLVFFAAVAQQF